MKVFITGGAGYIGTELTYTLMANPAVSEVVIYDNFSRQNYNMFIGMTKLSGKKVRFIQGELLDSRNLRKSLKGMDCVVHLAAKVTTPFGDQNPHAFEQTNNWGTSELVFAVEESDVSKFVYMSSVSVYGASSRKMDVDSPLNPRTFYGISKMRGEEHARRLFGKMPTAIVRCGNVYGYSKSMRFDAVVNKFMFDANFTNKISVNGDGTQSRSFIHIRKVVNTINKLIEEEFKSNYIDLVDRVLTVNEIVEALGEVYPEMEMVYVNQHLKLREIKVSPNATINRINESNDTSLVDELKEFKSSFTF